MRAWSQLLESGPPPATKALRPHTASWKAGRSELEHPASRSGGFAEPKAKHKRQRTGNGAMSDLTRRRIGAYTSYRDTRRDSPEPALQSEALCCKQVVAVNQIRPVPRTAFPVACPFCSCLKPENKDKLIAILKYHVIPGKVLAADVVKLDGQDVKTVEGSTARVAVKDGGVTINNAKVVKTVIDCTNGVIHFIDTVILPPAKCGQRDG